MKTTGGRLIERYIITAILPYLGLSVLLLTFVLLAQQAGKFVEILGSADPSLEAAADLILGLIPNTLIFTLPMSVLVGTATGLSRVGSDSELIAMRAAGVGTWRIVSPVLLLGFVFTLLTLYVGFEVAPKATHLMRQAAIKVALAKIESPIQPNTINTEMPDKVIYVGKGDRARGQWERVFIHWSEGEGGLRLITARSGRLDVTGEQTELVLTDAVVTTLPSKQAAREVNSTQIVTESSAQFRIRLNTGRNALLKKFQERQPEIDELHWREILEKSRAAKGSEKLRLLASLNKRLALCFASLSFALLGVGLGGRAQRVGRGQAILASLCVMLLYYLLLLGGEQLSRSGIIHPLAGSWLGTAAALIVGLGSLFVGERRGFFWKHTNRLNLSGAGSTNVNFKHPRSSILMGLLDQSLLRAVCFNFTLAYVTLLIIFLIFTLFELLRFITATEWRLVALYLLYLVPLASMSLAPISILVGVLVSYALLARRSEVIVWWASGQSLYRLSLPALFFSLLVSLSLAVLQESVLPQANRKQEGYRAQIRGSLNRATTATGYQWLAVPEARRLYTYKYQEGGQMLLSPSVYEFDAEGVHLKRLVMGGVGRWADTGTLALLNAEVLDFSQANAATDLHVAQLEIRENVSAESFKPMLSKPSELSSSALSAYIKTLKRVRPEEITPLYVSLYRRGADTSMPLILAVIGIPFGVFFGRRSTFWALGAAIVIGLALWASASGFQQLGNYRILPAALAAWATPLVFMALGLLLFSRART